MSSSVRPISVIVRAKNKVDTIGAALESLRAQTVEAEIIVVDSGSTDGTLRVAEKWADRVVEIAPEDFTYGGALNTGAAAASAPVHAALSAHCVLDSPTWLEDSLAKYERPDVAATTVGFTTPAGEPLVGTHFQTLEDVRLHPLWGFSNHASTWRADVWREFPFREDLVACEDKEWSWRVLAAGWTIAYAPELETPMGHRRAAGLRPLTERIAREAEAMVSLGAAAPLSGRTAVRAWWSAFPTPSRLPTVVRRVSPNRMAELLGSVRGSRRAVARGGEQLGELMARAGYAFRSPTFSPWGSGIDRPPAAA
jgi:rhamnosyltransferase